MRDGDSRSLGVEDEVKGRDVGNFLIQKSRCLGFDKAEYVSVSIVTHKL